VGVWDLIRSRRTVREFEPRPLPAGALERWLEAAVWAPNLGLTQPWRFLRLGPQTRAALQDLARRHAAGAADPLPCSGVALPLGQCAEAVAVAQQLDPHPEVRAADRLAMGAAIENILLAAWDDGWAASWLGGPLLQHPEVRSLLSVPSDQELVALLAFGSPAEVPPRPPRVAARARTRVLP